MTAAQMIAMTIFLFNFFSDSLSATASLTDLLPAEAPSNDTFSVAFFRSAACTDTGVSSKVGFDDTIVSTALRTSALSVGFAETVVPFVPGFSAAEVFARTLSETAFAVCIFAEAFVDGFAFALVFFAVVSDTGFAADVFAAARTGAFEIAFFAGSLTAVFALSFTVDFALVFFAGAFSPAFAPALFAAGFSAAFLAVGVTDFSTDAFFAVFFTAAAFSVVFVFAISLSFAIKVQFRVFLNSKFSISFA